MEVAIERNINESIKYLVETAKYFNKLMVPEYLIEQLNLLTENEIQGLLNEAYKQSRTQVYPVNLLRRIVLVKLEARTKITIEDIEEIKQAIIAKNLGFINKYVSIINKNMLDNSKIGDNPFQVWSTPFRLLYTIFYFKNNREIQLKVQKCLKEISDYTIDYISTNFKIQFSSHSIDFNGSQAQGRDIASLLFFPSIFPNHKKCAQLILDFTADGLLAKIGRGKDLRVKIDDIMSNKGYSTTSIEIQDVNELENTINQIVPIVEDINIILSENDSPILNMLSIYKDHIKKVGLNDEHYKWKLLGLHQGRPNLNATNFEQEFLEVDYSNLLYQYALNVAKHLVKTKPIEYKSCLSELFNETKPLNDRIRSFIDTADELYKSVKAVERHSHQHDERTAATFLTFYNPTKYTFYKSSFYEAYCKFIKVNTKKTGQKYNHYLGLMNELVDNYIKQDRELIGLIQSQLDTDDFHDDNLLLLAQDILYQCFDKNLIHTRNYWIFQANPDIFDVFSALKDNKVKSWLVNQNKGKVKSGDKVILWVTGVKSGCYALAEVSDNPKEVGLESDDHFWKTTKPSGLRAPITITHNYIDNPILKSEIMNIEELKKLKAGSQGTNLKATKEEFEFLLKLRNGNSNNFPNNLILYGPPGTGKTFNSKIKAQEIDGTSSNSFITFHQSFSYEQFVEGISVCTDKENKEIVIYEVKGGIFKKVCLQAIGFDDFENFLQEYDDKEKRKEYLSKREPVVLIIDEINRGNISKIFGELITLLEEDKRLGEDNEIIVTLPYSGEQFGVPPNLYIIGTMNTADRSLVQLDTALRRRFDFEEMMPKYDFWSSKVGDFDLNLFLQRLNEKICELYDREHQIGHSFLMAVNDIKKLQRAWENRIMPLLQEYFYADYGNLAQVIGESSEYLKKDNEKWKLKMKASEGNFEKEFFEVYKFVVNGKNTNQQTNVAEEQDEEIEA